MFGPCGTEYRRSSLSIRSETRSRWPFDDIFVISMILFLFIERRKKKHIFLHLISIYLTKSYYTFNICCVCVCLCSCVYNKKCTFYVRCEKLSQNICAENYTAEKSRYDTGILINEKYICAHQKTSTQNIIAHFLGIWIEYKYYVCYKRYVRKYIINSVKSSQFIKNSENVFGWKLLFCAYDKRQFNYSN